MTIVTDSGLRRRRGRGGQPARTAGEQSIENFRRVAEGDGDVEAPDVDIDISVGHRPFNAPDFPEAALVGAWGDLIRLWEPWTEAHPASIVLPALVMLGSHGGEGVRVGRQRTVEYLAVIGPSTVGRKDTGVNIAADFVEAVGGRRPVLGQPNSGEGLWYAMRDPAGDDPGAADKRLCLLDTEMAATLAASHRHGSTVLPALLSLYDDGRREPLTKRDRITVSNATFSYIGLTTPEQFALHLTDADRHSGILQRLLTAAVHRVRRVAPSRALNPAVNELELANLAATVRNRMDESVSQGRVWQLSRAASDHLDKVADSLVDSGRPETGRGYAHALRLAMIYALTVPPDPLDAEERGPCLVTMFHLRAGIAAWTYCSKSAALVLSNNTLIDKIVALAEDAGKDGLTRTELFRHTGNNVSAAELTAALQAGKQQGLLQVVELRTGRPGRPGWLVRST